MKHPRRLIDIFHDHRYGKERKYRNQPEVVNGIKFASKKEAARYGYLGLLVKQGIITDLELQPRYPIIINGIKVTTYVADFRYKQYGKTVVEDTKGYKTDVYKIKKKLMSAVHGIEIEEP